MDRVKATLYASEFDIIEALGGSREVATRVGIGQPAVCNWFNDGIPYRRFADLIEMATERAVPGLTLAVLTAMRKRRDASAQAA